MPQPTVVHLARYPVKSCRGLALDEADVHPRGFDMDRRFMVVTPEGRFRTQRKDPRMATVVPTLEGNDLLLSRDGMEPLAIDLAAAAEAGPRMQVGVWRWKGEAVDQGDAAAAWASEAVGAPSRLVFMPDDVRRPVNRANAVTKDDVVSFADGYPYLLATTGSLAELNEHASEPVPMDRFRPNIVIDTDAPWVEHDWRELRIGDARFAVTTDCKRCVITTTDQQSGERQREPLATLARINRSTDGPGVLFGINMVPLGAGRIRVGDPVEVLA